MNCIQQTANVPYTSDLIVKLTKLYQFKGKDFYYEEFFKNTLQGTIKVVIEKDCKFCAKMLGLKITDNRVNLILKKDSEPKTNDEKILANLKYVFTLLQEKNTQYILDSNEYIKLAYNVFKDVEKIEYKKVYESVRHNLLEEKVTKSLRTNTQDIFNEYVARLPKTEVTLAVSSVFIDLFALKPLNKYNEFVPFLALYGMLFRQRFNLFKHISFFELLYNDMENVKYFINQAVLTVNQGFPNIQPFNVKLIDLLLAGYEQVEGSFQDKKFDKALSKEDLVKITIMKLGQTFTKNEIREKHPEFSMSTIDRALESLKAEKKISAMGTGRSAAWTKIGNDESIASNNKQLTLLDLMEGDF